MTDADFYRGMFKESSFISDHSSNITAIFNSDGVSVYMI